MARIVIEDLPCVCEMDAAEADRVRGAGEPIGKPLKPAGLWTVGGMTMLGGVVGSVFPVVGTGVGAGVGFCIGTLAEVL